MTDATAKKQAELESDDDEDEDTTLPLMAGNLFRDASSSPDLPPMKRAKASNGASTSTKVQARDTPHPDASETEASEASTDVYSDPDKLVSELLHTSASRLTRQCAKDSMRLKRPVPTGKNTASAKSARPDSTYPEKERVAKSGMGAFSNNTEYNIEQIFTDLVFYLDTLANASKNFLQGSSKQPSDDDEEE